MKKDASRAAKLAAALKDNLKRRKAQARARGSRLPRSETGEAPHHEGASFEAPRVPRGAPQDEEEPAAKELGTAAQAGLETAPQNGPNAAKKR